MIWNHTEDMTVDLDSVMFKFDWVLMSPYPGQIEMNMLHSLVEMMWPIMWETVCKYFNSRPKCHKSSEMYKTIKRYGTVYPLHGSPSPESWCSSMSKSNCKHAMLQREDDTYAFLAYVIVGHVSLICMYRIGVRYNSRSWYWLGGPCLQSLGWSQRHILPRNGNGR